MYRVSKNVRKYSPTPIVKVYIEDGKEKEEMVFVSTLKKEEGNKLSQKVVELLNSLKPM